MAAATQAGAIQPRGAGGSRVHARRSWPLHPVRSWSAPSRAGPSHRLRVLPHRASQRHVGGALGRHKPDWIDVSHMNRFGVASLRLPAATVDPRSVASLPATGRLASLCAQHARLALSNLMEVKPISGAPAIQRGAKRDLTRRRLGPGATAKLSDQGHPAGVRGRRPSLSDSTSGTEGTAGDLAAQESGMSE